MPDLRELSRPNEKIPQGKEVVTPDGLGVTLSIVMRKNTNGGPGCRQYRIKLHDGRIRHYNMSKVQEKENAY